MMNRDFAYNVRTLVGLLLIAGGVVCGVWLAWWFTFQGDIIELIHTVKMELPGWVWTVLKVGLSGVAGIALFSVFILLAVVVFSGGGRK
jgi:hypothetical protein